MEKFTTYVINLKKDTRRKEWMKIVESKTGLCFNYFEAIAASEISTEIIQRYFSHVDFYEWNINQKAAMAVFLSHISVLEKCIEKDENTLVLEDDIDLSRKIDWENLKFEEFDIYNLGTEVSCYAYFVTPEGAKKIKFHFENSIITQAYDWELLKISGLKTMKSQTPIFTQVENMFESNIAPNGYNRILRDEIHNLKFE